MNKIEIPSNIKYRVKKSGNEPYQPQYLEDGMWKNCQEPHYATRESPSVMRDKTFKTIEEAEKYVDDLLERDSTELYYKDNWK